jgi:hypothetical protein
LDWPPAGPPPDTADEILQEIHKHHGELADFVKSKKLADVHHHAFAIRDEMYGQMEEILRSSGAEIFPYRKVAPYPLGSVTHEAGGCRMGDDPKTSLLDPWSRCHEIKNLLVVDAAISSLTRRRQRRTRSWLSPTEPAITLQRNFVWATFKRNSGPGANSPYSQPKKPASNRSTSSSTDLALT